MTVTNIIYTKVTMQNQPSGASMPGMKWMMYLMPLMFLVFFNNYAAGLSYYYFLSLLITIVQTYVFRHVVNEEKMRAKMQEASKKPRKSRVSWPVLKRPSVSSRLCYASRRSVKGANRR